MKRLKRLKKAPSDNFLLLSPEFSCRSRHRALERMREEVFDFLIVGGGITGAAVARDAVRRGLSVALVEKRDFAWGTSSRSSKLIHGGLRYLENFEFKLVFEALAERALLLKTIPHMVKPLPFYLPVFKGGLHPKWKISLGLWLYDLLALFRTPGFHRNLNQKKMLADFPFLKSENLQGGFRYFDASMWDDSLVVEVLRSASSQGAAVANYIEAMHPLWSSSRMTGFKLRDTLNDTDFQVKARQVIVCTGPWTDEVGKKLSPSWTPWLKPSKGVHLVFDLKRIPVPGAMVMTHPQDGRISFVIPRPEFGAGVVIVGTTDGPAPTHPEDADINQSDVTYLLGLLDMFFPELKLSSSDILSAYVGVRPLVDLSEEHMKNEKLQKMSREHHIGRGPGGSVVVAGGKYTTHRKMAEEIVDFALEEWRHSAIRGEIEAPVLSLRKARTEAPVNSETMPDRRKAVTEFSERKGIAIPPSLLSRYGAEALTIATLDAEDRASDPKFEDPEGFPMIRGQLRHEIRAGMVIRLEDFYLRRAPLYSSRKDHGLPWALGLSQIWADELGFQPEEGEKERARLIAEIEKRSAWRNEI